MWERLRHVFGIIGPGVVTGAADDDPSGIATYSQVGAQFGYGQLWSVPIMLPMMAAVQEVSGRIGMVTGKGIAGVMRDHYPRRMLLAVVVLIVVANTINLGTDLCAMSAATELLIPIPHTILIMFFGLLSLVLQVVVSYRLYRRFLIGMSAFLLAYVLTGIIVCDDWTKALLATIIPHIEWSFEFLMMLVGVLGTTISPYLFFWQASQEVEEEIENGRLCPPADVRRLRCGPLPVIKRGDISRMRVDTWSGMLFSQAATWFIIVTTAATLHSSGITNITSAAGAAQALEPLVRTFPHSGEIAKIIFAVGIIGLGLLAIPVFAGAASYAISEAFEWNIGLFRRPEEAPQFYAVIIGATLVGMLVNCAGINPIRALVYTAVINGLAAVPLIYAIMRIGANPRVMGEHVNTRYTTYVGWLTFGAMALAVFAMLAAFLMRPQ